MKLKQLSVLAITAIMFSATLAPAAFANPSNRPLTISQTKPKPRATGIRLTPDQQKKLAQIQANTRSQIEKIFTDEQKRTAEARLKAGIPPRQVFAELKFTPQQRQKMQQVFIASQRQIEALLTNEQKQQLIQQQQQRRQQQQQKK